MENYSINYIGVIISVLSFIAQKLQLNILPGDIETTITTITLFIGAIIALYGRWRRGEITFLGVRK